MDHYDHHHLGLICTKNNNKIFIKNQHFGLQKKTKEQEENFIPGTIHRI